MVKSSRTNYDLAVVYNWEKTLDTLYRKLPGKAVFPDSAQPQTPKQTRSSKGKMVPPKVTGFTHGLDTHALLHIRNFWHRHLIEEPRGFGSRDIVENTYTKMAKDLMQAGIVPKEWDKPLKNNDLQISTEWYGHYSTLASWPRKKQELEEVQSLAEDWHEVDPLVSSRQEALLWQCKLTGMQKLDFAISTNNDEDGFWPPIFRAIPAFEKTVPDLKSATCKFIRGLAPFIDFSATSNNGRASSSASTPSGSQATLALPTATQLPKYHPYLAMRLRGVIQSIPAQPQSTKLEGSHSIRGFNRICMVMFKPNKRYLIQVLEHAEEEFGDTFGPAITSQMLQNGASTTPAQTVNQILSGNAFAPGGQALDPIEVDAQLNTYLRAKLGSNPLWRDGTKFNKDAVEEMEENFRSSEYLDWNDIDYAYAYEGVVLPGGKIMMGRWWRIAPGGEGEGMEWTDALGEVDGEAEDAMDMDGDGDPDTVVVQDGIAQVEAQVTGLGGGNGSRNGNRRRYKKLERGPFIFWC